MGIIRIQYLVFALLYCVSIISSRYNSSDSNKKVFAHMMVAFTYSVNESFYDEQIKRAKSVGIDGFALNVGNGELIVSLKHLLLPTTMVILQYSFRSIWLVLPSIIVL